MLVQRAARGEKIKDSNRFGFSGRTGKQPGLTVDTAKRLARVLGVGIDYLAGTWEDEEDEILAAVAS
jgi:hypothetical protein